MARVFREQPFESAHSGGYHLSRVQGDIMEMMDSDRTEMYLRENLRNKKNVYISYGTDCRLADFSSSLLSDSVMFLNKIQNLNTSILVFEF